MKILLLISVGFFLIQVSVAQKVMKEILYVGTYSDGNSKGVYVIEIDRSSKSSKIIQTVDDKLHPTFLTVHPNQRFLYVAYREGADEKDKNGTVAAYQIDQDTGTLTPLNSFSSMGASPCHISVDPDGRMLLVSNYLGGNLGAYKINEDGSLMANPSFIQHTGKGSDPQRQKEPHVHSIIPSLDGDYVYVSDLGTDKIVIYKVNADTGQLTPADMPYVSSEAGAGPRHFVIHPELPFAYSVEELSNTVAVYRVHDTDGSLRSVGRINMLSDQINSPQNSAADIHLSKDGRFLYASNRGQDNLVIYQIDPTTGLLSLVGHQPSGGQHPRNFKMDEKGELVFVANMDSDNVVVFSQDSSSGKLQPTGWEMTVPRAVCIEQIEL